VPNGSELDDCGIGKLGVEFKVDIQERLFDYSATVTGEKIEKI
jgi:hypothetical protein